MFMSQDFVSLPRPGGDARLVIDGSVSTARPTLVSESEDVRTARPVLLTGAAVMVAGAAVAALAMRRSASSATKSVSLQALPVALEGTGGPFGNEVWDPAGLMNGRTEEQILHWRAVELKHCRVAMLAVVGWLHIAAGWHFIGDAAAGFRVSDDPLVNVTQVPMGGMWQLIFTLMCLEWVQTYPCPPPKGKPWDVLGWTPIIKEDGEFAEEWKSKQLQELNNGRLAMFGILGLIGQDISSGDYGAWIHQPNFGQSNPLDWRGEPPFEMPALFPLAPIDIP